MKLLKLSWILSRKRLIIGLTLDYLIFFLLIFVHGRTNNKYLINNHSLIIFSFLWVSISYVFGRYFFKKNNSLYTAFKIYLFNTLKVFILTLFIFLLAKSLLNIKFAVILYPILSLKFISLFFIFSFLGHALLITYINKKSTNLRKWIYIGKNKNFVINKKIDFKNYIHQIDIIDNFKNLFEIDYESNKYIGIILSKDEKDFDFRFFKEKNLLYFTLKDWCQQYLQRYPPEILVSFDIFRMKKFLNDKTFEMRLKRFADIVLSTILLLISSPVLLIFSILIYLEDPGPILYSQIRNGHDLRTFHIYKLRSMKVDSERYGPQWASNNDIRINKVGKIIRATRIDELPQLWSVLKGEMSLIGPRPERPEFDIVLDKKIPFYSSRYLVKPGLSGWAQVNYPYGASDTDARNKLSFDLYYIENFTFFLDLLIFFKTIRLVLNARGSEEGAEIL